MMKKICTDGSLDNSSLFSAEAVVNNEDLIREIFLHLPVRSLIRFKLVSKQWSSLISDPQFTHDHTHQTNPNYVVPSGLFFYNSLTNSQEIELVSLDDSPIQLSSVRVPSLSFLNSAAAAGSKITILQSCNGLLLFQFTLKYRDEYCVCNPTTKKYKILPQLILNPEERVSGFTLVFDPSISPHYKVVCLNIEFNSIMKIERIEIYSSETGKWNTSAHRSYQSCYDPLERSGFYWNGSIHWIKQGNFRYRSYQYDFEKDNFYRSDMPPNPKGFRNRSLRYFGESKGCLHLVYLRTRSSMKFHVLERDRETMKWSVKYRVHICHLLSKFPEIRVRPSNYRVFRMSEYAFSILSVYKGEKEEDSALVLTIPGKVVSYNLHYKTSKVLCELPSQVIDAWESHYCTGFNFIETFASV